MAAYTAGFMTHVTCRLTAKNRDQLRNPTLGSRVWATFFTFIHILLVSYLQCGIRVGGRSERGASGWTGNL